MFCSDVSETGGGAEMAFDLESARSVGIHSGTTLIWHWDDGGEFETSSDR